MLTSNWKNWCRLCAKYKTEDITTSQENFKAAVQKYFSITVGKNRSYKAIKILKLTKTATFHSYANRQCVYAQSATNSSTNWKNSMSNVKKSMNYSTNYCPQMKMS